MKLTNEASDTVLKVMNDKGLDPQEWFLEFRLLENGAIGIGFTKTQLRKVLDFGKLRLTIDGVIDTEGVVIDYGEHEGRKGLFFMADGFSPDAAENQNAPRANTGDSPAGATLPPCGDPECTCDGECGGDCKCQDGPSEPLPGCSGCDCQS